MGHASTWKNPSTHITYKRGDKIVVTGVIQKSADGQSGTYGSVTKRTYYFYSYYTASWTVRAPICIGTSSGTGWAFVTANAIVSGGTNESYTIKYDANGGTGAPGSQTKNYAVNITLSNTKPVRTGYTFTGWNTKREGTGTTYAAGAIFKVNAATTLYAQWSPYTHTIAYDANGGTGAPANQIKKYGSNITLSSTKPVRTGYTFTGWNTKREGTGTTYASEQTYEADQNGGTVILYAQWEVDNICAVKTLSGWKYGQSYIKINGKWVKGERVYAKVNGTWKLGMR